MRPVRRAVIDVGTNSIKLLVAEVAGTEVRPLLEQSKQTRLGQGFYQTHRLQAAAIGKSAEAIAGFASEARELQAETIRVIATSATRDARNAGELLDAVKRAAGLNVEIISGEREADLAFQGVTTDPALAQVDILLLDVGGGSTEFVLGRGTHKNFSQSFPLGTVRLMEQLPHTDPPAPEHLHACRDSVGSFLQGEVQPRLGPALQAVRGPAQMVGTGGTASILGCMEAQLTTFDRERLEATRLSRERLRWHVERLWSLPLARRRQIVGLPPNRADVILTGTVIYEGILQHFGFPELRITTRGLRFAAVL